MYSISFGDRGGSEGGLQHKVQSHRWSNPTLYSLGKYERPPHLIRPPAGKEDDTVDDIALHAASAQVEILAEHGKLLAVAAVVGM